MTIKERILTTIVVLLVIISMLPAAFADDENDDDRNDSNDHDDYKDSISVSITSNSWKALEEQREKALEFQQEQQEKLERMQKEQAEKFRKMQEKQFEKLKEFEQRQHEKLVDLNERELKKASAMSRGQLDDLMKLQKEQIKKALEGKQIITIRYNDDYFDVRNVSSEELDRLKSQYNAAKERYDKAKEELKDAKKALQQAKKQGNSQASFNHTQTYLLGTADALIQHLEKVKIKVLENQFISNQTAAQLVTQLDSHITVLGSIKTQIHGSTTWDQLRASANRLQQESFALKSLTGLHADQIAAARVQGIVNKGIVLEKRLDIVLDDLAQRNVSVNVTSEIAQFSKYIADAKNQTATAQHKLDAAFMIGATNNASIDQIQQLRTEAHSLLLQARASIQSAHDILKIIIQKIRTVAPTADLTADISVEIVE